MHRAVTPVLIDKWRPPTADAVWVGGRVFLKQIVQAFPLSPLLLPSFYFFVLFFTSHRSPLSERLEQANVSGASYIASYITIGIHLILVKATWPWTNQWRSLPSPSKTFSQSLSVNSFRWLIRGERAGNIFAWTTWPETLWPRGKMRPTD